MISRAVVVLQILLRIHTLREVSTHLALLDSTSFQYLIRADITSLIYMPGRLQ